MSMEVLDISSKPGKNKILDDIKNHEIKDSKVTTLEGDTCYWVRLGEEIMKVNKMDLILKEISEMKLDIKDIKTDVANLKTDVAELKFDVSQLKIEAIKHGWDIK